MSHLFLSLLLLLSIPGLAQTSAQPASTGYGDYVLRPGDSIEVTYTYTPEFNDTVPIPSDGTVGLKRVGPVNVAGSTLRTATAKITAAAAKSGLRNPELVVTLRDYVRPQFTVLGEVMKPGKYELRGNIRVADALAVAGGLSLNARHKNIILIHPIDETTGTTTLISYKALEKTKGDIPLEQLSSGDIIVVPTGDLSKVERVVKIANLGVFYNPF